MKMMILVFKLATELMHLYKGETTTRKKIYEKHNIGTPYIDSNYKDALLMLEKEGKIIAEPHVTKRRLYKGKPTLGEDVILKFKN